MRRGKAHKKTPLARTRKAGSVHVFGRPRSTRFDQYQRNARIRMPWAGEGIGYSLMRLLDVPVLGGPVLVSCEVLRRHYLVVDRQMAILG